jgi:DNA-binding CsgD family transcriptional regulator
MLLGRSTEKRHISRLLKQAAEGNSGALLILGDAGIGKSALLEHAERQAAGWTVLRARGTQYDAQLPFAGLAELLRPVTSQLAQIPERQAAALAGALAIGPPQPTDHFAIYAATLSMLAAVSETKPLLVTLDDAQWLDRSSQAALAFVVGRLSAEPIAILVAQRSDPSTVLDSVSIPRLVLSGVSPEAGRRIIADSVAKDVAPAVADRIFDTSGGNPLALRELPTLLTGAQLSGHEPLPDPLPVSADLRQLYLRKIAKLPTATRRALLVAAANGSGPIADVTGVLAELGLDIGALERAEAAGIVSMGTDLRFAHPLIRASVYHDATAAARRETHRALGGALTGRSDARRAWHLAAATVGQDESVAAAMDEAAGDASRRGAHAVAAQTLERAAALTPDDAPRMARLMGAATAFHFAGQPDRAVTLLEQARDAAADPVLRAEVEHLRGRVLLGRGPLSLAHEVLADAAHAIEGSHPAKAATMLGDSALACLMSGRAALSQTLTQQAFRLTGERNDEGGEVVHLLFTGVLVMAGRAREAEPHIERERERIAQQRAAGDWQSLVLSAIWLMWAEELALVDEVLTGAIDDARRLGMPGLLPLALAERSELRWRTGDWTRALADAGEAVRLAQETGQNVILCFARASLALVLAGLGREAECRAVAAAAIEGAVRVGSDSTFGRADAALGLLELGMGNAAAAVHHLRQAHAYVQAHGVNEPTVVPFGGDLLEAFVRAGRIADANETLEWLDERASSTGRDWTRAVVARGRGLLAPEGAYEEHFIEALALHDRLPTPFETARTRLAYGERLRRSGLRVRARESLRNALEEFLRLGATPWAVRARTELRATGESGARPRRAGMQELTPQELQVAFAVATGSTNREAAASLFLSPKTIEFHLSNVYSKLEIRSRSELVRLVASQSPSVPRSS